MTTGTSHQATSHQAKFILLGFAQAVVRQGLGQRSTSFAQEHRVELAHLPSQEETRMLAEHHGYDVRPGVCYPVYQPTAEDYHQCQRCFPSLAPEGPEG